MIKYNTKKSKVAEFNYDSRPSQIKEELLDILVKEDEVEQDEINIDFNFNEYFEGVNVA